MLDWLAPWPGNMRELANVLERSAILVPGDQIGAADLEVLSLVKPPGQRALAKLLGPDPADPPAVEMAAADERTRIKAALERCAGNQTRAARLLGISRGTLLNRLNEYDLPRPRKGLS